MSLTKELKISLGIALALLITNLALVFAFPSKPLKIREVSLPTSAIDPQIKVSFSEPVEKSSLTEGGFILTPDVPGNISWAGNTFVFTPQENLDFNREYRLQLNTTIVSKRNTYLSENLTFNFNTPPLKLLYLNSTDGQTSQIFEYDLETTLSTPITDSKFNIHWFDYDPTTGQIVTLLTDSNTTSDILKPYLLSPETKTIEPLPKITTPNHQIHYAKWIPYENSLLISRSRIKYVNPDQTVATLTGNAEDTEIVTYNLATKKVTQLLTGNTLFYEFFPTPDGLGFSFINSNGALVAYNFATAAQELISAQFVNYFGFSHYGRYVLYADKIADANFLNEEDVAILQNSSGEKQVFHLSGVNPISIDYLATSPSDEILAAAYTSYPANFRIALINLTDNLEELLNQNDLHTEFIAFSPDSSHFAYIENDGDTRQISIYSLLKKENIVENLPGSMIHWLY